MKGIHHIQQRSPIENDYYAIGYTAETPKNTKKEC